MDKHYYKAPELLEFELETRTSVCLDASVESFNTVENDEDFNMFNVY